MLSEKEKKDLKQKIQSNKHEIYVVSFDEMEAIINSSRKANDPYFVSAWRKIKGKVKVGANYIAAGEDLVTITKLVSDLGGIGARAYIKSYGGKPHIVLKGHPGLRTILTGTKYGIKNPKVITMGLGKAGAVSASKQGGIVSVIFLSLYRVADYFLTDEATLSQLVGALATDIVKVGIATGASIVAATAIAGLTTVAIGPILAVIVVGLGVTRVLDYADNSLGITNRIIAGLDELGENAESYINKQKQQALSSAGEAIDEIIDQAVSTARSLVIHWVQSKIKEYLSPMPRV